MANWWEQSEEKKKLEQKAQPAQPFRAPQQLVQNVLDTVQSAAQKVQEKAAEHAKQEAALPNWWKNSQERQGLQAKVSESRQYQSYLEKLKAAAPAQYAAETMGPAKLQRELGRSQEALRQAQEARSTARQQNQDWRPSYMTNIQPAQKDAYDLEYDRAYRDSAVMEQAQRIQNANRRENMYQSIRDRMEALKTGSPADYDAKVKAGREAFEAKQNSAREAEIWQAINEDRAWNPQLRDAGGSNYDKRIDSSLLSNQQKNHFYALYAEDPEQAEEWLGTAYERQQNKMLDTVSTLAGYNAGTRAVAAVGSAAMGLASGLDPYNDFGQGTSKIANALARGGAEGLPKFADDVPIVGGKGLGDLYQLSISMLQSGALVLAAGASGGAAPVVELLGTTLMGSSAAASDYTDCIENRGMSRDQAMLHATAAGIAEAAFEYVSLDKLVNQDITRGFIKNFFMQGGIEASEELCTTVANRITDAALARAGGYDNQIEQRMKELIALGLDTREAKAKAEREWVTELISDGLGGFLSGGTMTGINTGLHAGDYNRMNRYLEQTGRDSMRSGEAAVLRQYAEDNGLGWYGETEAPAQTNDNGGQIARATENGETDSSAPAEASAQNDEGTDSSPAAQNDKGEQKKSRAEIRQERQERMGQRQTGSDVERIQKHINQQMEGKSIQEQQALRDQLQERYGEGILPAAYAAIQEDIRNVTQDMSPDQIRRAMTEALKQTNDREIRGAIAQAYSQAGAEAANKKGGSSEVAKFYQQMRNTGRGGMTMQATVTAKDGTRQQVEIQNFTEDGKGIRLSNGQTVAINKDLNKNLEADADTVDAIQRLAEFGLGKDTDAVFQLYKGTSPQTKTDGYRWIMDAAMAYDQGRVGRISMLEAMRRSSLDRQTVAQLYKMGQRSDTADTQARQARIDQARQEAGQESQANVDAKAIKGIELTETEKEQFEMANDIFRAIGVDLVWFASDADGDGTFRGKNGAYLNGKVYLDIHAGRNFASDLRSGILATAGHELTHFLQDYAPKAYKSLRRFLLDQIAGNAANGELTLERLIDDKMRRSSEGITREEALDEVVADACQRMLLDSKALHDYAEQAPGHMKRLRGWVKDWYERIKAAFGKSTELSYEARLMNSLAEDVREAFGDLWDAALREAVETHREVGNLKGEKNTAQEGGARYSRRQEILARNDVAWMGDFTSIKDQLEAHRDEISGMDPVAEVTYAGEDKDQLVDLIMDQIPGLGGAKMIRNGVSFEFDRNGAKYIVLHARSEELRAAALLAPIVAKKGKLIAGQKSHEGTNTTTLTYAAPAIINGTPVNVGLVIQFTSNGRPRAVNVETESGGVLRMNKTAQGLRSRTGKSQVTQLLTRAVSDDRIAQSKEGVNPSTAKKSERDYSYDFSDADLILDAADLAADPETAESYWKELLDVMDRKDAVDARAQLKGIREQGKKIQELEAKLENAMHQMEQTDRKLRTQGIGKVTQAVMEEFEVSDAKKRGVAKKVTETITQAYQKALDAMDNGAEAAAATDILYEGAVKAANILLNEGTHTERHGGKWAVGAYSSYIKEDRQLLIDTMVSKVYEDFAVNRYREPMKATAADRLVERTERRMQKKIDEARDRARTVQEANDRLQREIDYAQNEADASKQQVGELAQQLRDLRDQVKEDKQLTGQERSKAQRRIKTLENALKAKRSESQAWKQLADKQARQLEKDAQAMTIQGINSRVELFRARLARTNEELRANKAERALNDTTRKLNETARKLSSTANQLQKQLEREQRILNGMLKPPAIQKLLKAEREKAVTKAEAHKDEVFRNYKERKNQTAIRNRIKNLHAEMQRDLLKPREGHFVPEALIRPVVELLDMVNTQTNRAKSENAQAKIDAINAQYDKLKNDERYSAYYDETVKALLVELSATLEGRSIYDLNSDELADVYTAMKAMRTTIRNAIKADLVEKGKEIWEIGNELRQELRNSKGANAYLLEKYHMSMLNAQRAFNRFGGYRQDSTWNKVYRMLDNAQLDMLRIEMEATRLFDPVLKAKADFEQAQALTSIKEKDLVDVGLKDADGKAVKITRGMMLGLWMHLQNEDNMRHLMYGGLTLPDFKRYYAGNSEAWGRGTVEIPALGARVPNLDQLLAQNGEEWVNEQYREQEQEIREMFESVRASIEEKLTPYEKKWIAASKDFFDNFSRRELNRVTNSMYGFSKAKVDNYFPIVTDSNFLKSEFDSISRNMSLENAGFMKERVRAANPILLEDITRTVNRQISNVSRYAGLTEALKQFGNIYNVQTKGFTDSVKKAMAKSYGKTGQEYIQNLITDMVGGRSTPGTIFDRIKGNYAQAVLSANLSVTIKQAASFPTAAATVGWKPLMKALAKGGKDGRVISRADRTLIDTYSPLLWKRSQGAIDTEIGDMAHAQDWTKKAKWLMGWIEKTDIATVGRLWYAAEYYVKDNFKGLEKGTVEQIRNGESEYYRKVAEIFNRIVEETQPNYTVLQRPDILRNPNKLLRSLVMFSTQRFQNGQILMDAAAEYGAMRTQDRKGSTAETKAARQEAKRKLTWAITSQVVSAVVLNAMTLLAGAVMHRMNPWRDDDDEITLESTAGALLDGWVESMAGSFLGGSELYEALDSLLTGSTYYGNDVGGLSSINDFASALITMGQKAVKLVGDENSKPEDWGNLAKTQLWKVGEYLSQMTGVPVANIKKILAGGVLHVQDAIDTHIFSYEAGLSRSNTANARRYAKAWEAGDSAKMQAVIAEMNRNLERDGKSTDGARDAVSKAAKELYEAGEVNVEEYMDFLRRAGYLNEEKIQNKVRDILRDELSTGDRSEEDVISALMEYVGWDEDKAWKKVREWSETAEHAEDEDYSYSTYKPLYEAIDANHEIADMVAEMTAHGIQESNIKSQVKGYLVEQYVAGKVSKDKLKNQLSRYCKIVATDDVSKILNDADCKKACGYGTGELNEAYRAGNLDSSTVSSMLQRYGGMSAADAKKRVRWLDLQKANPSLEVSESSCNNWYDGSAKSRENGHESAKAAGMSIEQYLQAKAVLDKAKDANGNGTGEDEVIAALSQMNLTARQKDALYYERYKGTTKYSKKTW